MEVPQTPSEAFQLHGLHFPCAGQQALTQPWPSLSPLECKLLEKEEYGGTIC